MLAPMLGKRTGLAEQERFPTSIAIVAPICVVSLFFTAQWQLTLQEVLPYLLGSAIGGVGAGYWGKRIPTHWLHRFLGIILLWGGIRYLCQ